MKREGWDYPAPLALPAHATVMLVVGAIAMLFLVVR